MVLLQFNRIRRGNENVKQLEYRSIECFAMNYNENQSLFDFASLIDEDIDIEYFEDLRILIIHYYPIQKVYKLGQTFEECKCPLGQNTMIAMFMN